MANNTVWVCSFRTEKETQRGDPNFTLLVVEEQEMALKWVKTRAGSFLSGSYIFKEGKEIIKAEADDGIVFAQKFVIATELP